MTRHHDDCDFWLDQYPWECSCGLTPRMSHLEWDKARRERWSAEFEKWRIEAGKE